MLSRSVALGILIYFGTVNLFGWDSGVPKVQLGRLQLAPSGFLEYIGDYRSVGVSGNVSTKFGAFPIRGGSEWAGSLGHSRAMLDAVLPLGGGTVTGYLEADFMNRNRDLPFRWRQFYAAYSTDKWEVAGGQMWSLLRPNRVGISSRADLMNTRVVDPGYHLGLAGYRNQQVRVVRHVGAWNLGASVENWRDFLPKVSHDGKRLHWEVVGVVGRRGHHGASVALHWKLNRRVTLLTQQFWARGGGRDALSVAPLGVAATSSLGGIEIKGPNGLEFFSYAGMAYAGRSLGNRNLHQLTTGFSQQVSRNRLGAVLYSVQVSTLDRSLWRGGNGTMNFIMVAMRQTFEQTR